jgi:hypothetical protein
VDSSSTPDNPPKPRPPHIQFIDGQLYARIIYRDASGKRREAARKVREGEDLGAAIERLVARMRAQGLHVFESEYRGQRTFRVRTAPIFNRRQKKRQACWQAEIYTQAKRNAPHRKIPFELTRSEFDQIVEKADGCCMVSGIPFNRRAYKGTNRRPFAPSLDRIDSRKGYSLENCRLVCQIVNIAMNAWGVEPLMILAEYLMTKK